jgi:hypothetical protein
MLVASIPAKFGIPWAANAGGAYIRAIPQASQIGITAGAASLNDGWVPLNFTQIGAGGVPPFGQDFNGILNQITAWNQWQAAGGPVGFDATFAGASGINGYPKGAVIAQGGNGTGFVLGKYWLNSIDGNTANPDTGGANWTALAMLQLGVGANVGTFTRTKVTVDTYGRATAASSGAQPTYTKLTSGSGTYTPPVGAVRIHVRMAGGGGGANAIGGAGGTTIFGGWTAIGGGQGQGGGAAGAGGVGGTGGSNGTGVIIDRNAGAQGTFGITFSCSGNGNFGSANMSPGGTNRLGGGPNSGQGAPGGNSQAYNNSQVTTGAAGGASEYVEFDVLNPVAVPYTVGAGATNAQAGVILIEEVYD